MNEIDKLEKLLKDGFLLQPPILELAKQSQESTKQAHSFFDIKTNLDILLDYANKDKTLLRLVHPNTQQKFEILTADDRVIGRAVSQLKYQNQPVGTLIRIHVAALGGRLEKERVCHLNKLIPSLNGFLGWKFSLDSNGGLFKIEIEVDSTDNITKEKTKALAQSQMLLDYLAFYLGVGFHIQYSSAVHIPRQGSYISKGPEEIMVNPVATEVLKKVETIQTNLKILEALRGLNEAYVENTSPSRLSRLWAAVESVFGDKPQHLLTGNEVDELFLHIKQFSSLKNDCKRLGKLKDVLQKAPLTSRNKDIATNMSSVVNIDTEQIYEKVKKASELRGKHLHQIILEKSEDDIVISEKFLQEALISYLKTQGVPQRE